MPILFILILAVAVVFVIITVLTHAVSHSTSYSAGAAAERKVATELATLPQEEYITLNDLMLTTSYGTTQIDHVVLSTHGVYVIETKNYSGIITGNEGSEQWEQNIYGYRYKTGNALRQNKVHIDTIIRHACLGSNVPVYNIVVFSRHAEFNIYHEHGEVVYIDELLSTIQRLRSSEPIFTQEQIGIKANLLIQQNITNPEQRELHNQAVQNNKFERQNKIEHGVCPRCGGQLVLRNGKYSEFYGCSNYPKCDFTVKSLNTDYDEYNDNHRFFNRYHRYHYNSYNRYRPFR